MRRNIVSCILEVNPGPRVMPERWALQKFLTNCGLPAREPEGSRTQARRARWREGTGQMGTDMEVGDDKVLEAGEPCRPLICYGGPASHMWSAVLSWVSCLSRLTCKVFCPTPLCPQHNGLNTHTHTLHMPLK